MLSVLFFSCQKEEDEIVRVEVGTVSLSQQELTLYKGDTCVLTALTV